MKNGILPRHGVVPFCRQIIRNRLEASQINAVRRCKQTPRQISRAMPATIAAPFAPSGHDAAGAGAGIAKDELLGSRNWGGKEFFSNV